MSQQIKVRLVKSRIGYNKKQNAVLDSLGLRKINQEKVFQNNASVRGMITRVQHLVQVEAI